jgi:hypothetical protein
MSFWKRFAGWVVGIWFAGAAMALWAYQNGRLGALDSTALLLRVLALIVLAVVAGAVIAGSDMMVGTTNKAKSRRIAKSSLTSRLLKKSVAKGKEA